MFLQLGPSHISEVQKYFCQGVRTTSTFVRGSLKVLLLLPWVLNQFLVEKEGQFNEIRINKGEPISSLCGLKELTKKTLCQNLASQFYPFVFPKHTSRKKICQLSLSNMLGSVSIFHLTKINDLFHVHSEDTCVEWWISS